MKKRARLRFTCSIVRCGGNSRTPVHDGGGGVASVPRSETKNARLWDEGEKAFGQRLRLAAQRHPS